MISLPGEPEELTHQAEENIPQGLFAVPLR